MMAASLIRGHMPAWFFLALILQGTALRAENAIENSSFEVGTGHGWGRGAPGSGFFSFKLFDSNTAAHGKTSLRLPLTKQINVSGTKKESEEFLFDVISKWYALAPGKYTFSCSLKASQEMDVALSLKGSHCQGLGKTVHVGTSWERFHVTGILPDKQQSRSPSQPFVPDGLYSVGIRATAPSEGTLWIDAVQVASGELQVYAPASNCEVGLLSPSLGNVFMAGKDPAVQICLFGDAPGARQVHYKTTNYFGEIVAEDNMQIAQEAAGSMTQPFPLAVSQTGLYHVEVSLAGQPSTDEMVYSVLPEPRSPVGVSNPEGTLGGDNGGHVLEELEILKKANFSFLIHKHAARWSLIEPEEGRFVFMDNAVANADKLGLLYLFQPAAVQNPPAWIKGCLPEQKGGLWPDEKKKKYVDAWSRYLTVLVEHYKGKVKYWEIENEPYYQTTTQQYAEILKSSFEAIKKADAGSTVVGCCNYSAQTIHDILTQIGPSSCDIVSGHFYGNDHFYPSPNFVPSARYPNAKDNWRDGFSYASVLQKYGKPGWNSETGGASYSFYSSLPAPTMASGRAKGKGYLTGRALLERRIKPWTESRVKNYLVSLSRGGLSKYFIYNMRHTSSPRDIHADQTMNFVEYDGGLKAAAVGYSIASHFLDGTEFAGLVETGDERLKDFYVWREKANGKTVGAVWAQTDRELLIRFPPDGLALFDIMGRPITKSKENPWTLITSSVIYLRSDGDAARMREILAHVEIKSVPESIAKYTWRDGPHITFRFKNPNPLPVHLTFSLSSNPSLWNKNPNSVEVELEANQTRDWQYPIDRELEQATLCREVSLEGMVFRHYDSFRPHSARHGQATLDGDLQEWNMEKILDVAIGKDAEITCGVGNYFGFPDREDLAATLKFRWNEDALYVAAHVKDENVKCGKLELNLRDQLHIFLDTDVLGHLDVQSFSPAVAAIHFAPDTDGLGHAELLLGVNKPSPRKIPSACRLTPDGYAVELKIAWKDLGLQGRPANPVLGLNVALQDSDSLVDDADTVMVWVGGDEGTSNPQRFGTLLLAGEK